MPVPRIFAAQLTPREQWTHVLASVLALTTTEHRAALLRDFTDEDLLRAGYLDWLVERGEFKARVEATAAKLAGLAPLSMANMKRAIEQFTQAEPDIPRIREGIRECQTSEDLREGLAALRERRTPAFKGR